MFLVESGDFTSVCNVQGKTIFTDGTCSDLQGPNCTHIKERPVSCGEHPELYVQPYLMYLYIISKLHIFGYIIRRIIESETCFLLG